MRLFSPGAVLGCVELLIDPLEKTIMKKPTKAEDSGGASGAAISADQERDNELLRSALRCVLNLNKLEGIATISRKWLEFMERLRKSEERVVKIIAAIEAEKGFDI